MRKSFRFSMATLLAASIISLPACQKDWEDDINGLREDVDKNTSDIATLSATVSTLQSVINSGKIITSVTAVTNAETGATGWQLLFSDNSSKEIWNGLNGKNGIDGTDGQNGAPGKDGVDGTNGTNGVTPFVSIDKDGNWCVDYQDGKGAVAIKDEKGNKITAKGEKGEQGETGKDGIDGNDGVDGTDGVDGKNGNSIAVQVSEDGYYQFVVYNGTNTDGSLKTIGDPIKTPYPANPNTIISSVIIDTYTATFNINNYDEETGAYIPTSFSIPLASGKDAVALTNIVLLKEGLNILQGGTSVLPFKVVPSNASINTSNFTLEYVATYTRTAAEAPYEISKIEAVAGQPGYYNATIKATREDISGSDDAIFMVYKNMDGEETVSEITSTIPVKILTEAYSPVEDNQVSQFLADNQAGTAAPIYSNKSFEASLILLDGLTQDALDIQNVEITFNDATYAEATNIQFGTPVDEDKNGEELDNCDVITFTIVPNAEVINSLTEDVDIVVTATIADRIGNKITRSMTLPVKRILSQTAELPAYSTWISNVQDKEEKLDVDYSGLTDLASYLSANAGATKKLTVVKIEGETETPQEWTVTELSGELKTTVTIPATAEAGTYKLAMEASVTEGENKISSFTATKEIVIKSPKFRLVAKDGIVFSNDLYTKLISGTTETITFADLFKNVANVSDDGAPIYFNSSSGDYVKYKMPNEATSVTATKQNINQEIEIQAFITLPNGQEAPVSIIASDVDIMNPETFVSEDGSFKVKFETVIPAAISLPEEQYPVYEYDGTGGVKIDMTNIVLLDQNGSEILFSADDGKFPNIKTFTMTPKAVAGLDKTLVKLDEGEENPEYKLVTNEGASWTYGTTKIQTVDVEIVTEWDETVNLSFDLTFKSTIN